MSRTPPPVSGALHDLGDTTRQAAADVVDSVGTVVSAAVYSGRNAARDARHTVVDSAGGVTGTLTGTVGSVVVETGRRRRRASKKATRSAAAARKSVRSTRTSALTGAANAVKDARATARGLADDASAGVVSAGRQAVGSGRQAVGAGYDMARRGAPESGGKPSHTGRRLVQILIVALAIGAGAAAVRMVRPSRSGGTGASIPPKIRPVRAVPPESALGGLPVSDQEEAPVTEGDLRTELPDGDEDAELIWTSETDPIGDSTGLAANVDLDGAGIDRESRPGDEPTRA